MKIKEYYLGNRKIYRKKLDDNIIINIYCFACGFVIALMIAVTI